MGKKRLDAPMLGVIFALAWPTMLQELMQTAVQYIDTAMVGSLGTQATAAVGATGTVSWLVNGTVSALGVGFLAYISQAVGAGEQERAKRAAAQSALMALAVGVVLTILTTSLSGSIVRWMQVAPTIRDAAAQYFRILYLSMLFRTMNILFSMVLRAVGDSRTPMKVGLQVNFLNVLLNTLLIYPAGTAHLMGISFPMWGAGFGINGAAAASAIAYTYGGISMAVRLWRHPLISPRGQRFAPDPQVLKPCLKVAVPNMLQRFGTSLGYVAFASMINAFGGCIRRISHHCQYGGIPVLHPRLGNADCRGSAGGQRLRCPGRQKTEKPWPHLPSSGGWADAAFRRNALPVRA